MNHRATVLLTIGLFASAAGSSANAHHGYSQYDRCQRLSVEGEIEQISWANPHIVVTLKGDDAVAYRVEWISLQQLQRSGLASGILEVGDRVVVTGSKNRDPERVILTLLKAIDRPADGWHWSRSYDSCTEASR